MDISANAKLTPMVLGNDKLLKALITLLALRDEQLLEELRTIFVIAHSHRNPIGDASDEVWSHVQMELNLISTLLEDAEDETEQVLAPN